MRFFQTRAGELCDESGRPVPIRSAEARFIRTPGANLRRERTARGLTQERLAELADLNPRTVQKIEAGDITISSPRCNASAPRSGASGSDCLAEGGMRRGLSPFGRLRALTAARDRNPAAEGANMVDGVAPPRHALDSSKAIRFEWGRSPSPADERCEARADPFSLFAPAAMRHRRRPL